MEEKVIMALKRSFSNHWLMVRLKLKLDNVGNCEDNYVHER